MEPVIYFSAVRAPCGHHYCQRCLTRLFLASATDESLFPARCCQLAIPLAPVRTLLGPLACRRVKQRTVEFNDSARKYCSKPTCSAYIFAGQRKDNCGTCQECNQKTCLLCAEEFHQGRCIQKTDPTLQLALREGWKRCPHCKHLIELDTGCNHITCICRYEFCYLCGMRWRTCKCPLWEESRLYNRAHRIAARENPRPNGDAVREVANLLRGRHECGHERWKRGTGEYQCEECSGKLTEYIYECKHCRLHACRRCQFNRL